MDHLELLARLAQPAETKIVLLVLDGLGDIRTADQPATALELAARPNLDALATRGALGRIVPVAPGITTGSGPGHLALFGYDPTSPAADIGRGVLEALGIGMEILRGDVAVRGNFATADAAGNLTDRRAGRLPTAECKRLVARLGQAAAEHTVEDLAVAFEAGEGYRFVMRLRGRDLSPEVEDTDPQRLGVPPLPLTARRPRARSTVERLGRMLPALEAALAGEPRANRILLRGFSVVPDLPAMGELYQLRCGAFAGYPLYRGVAGACGMEVVDCGPSFASVLEAAGRSWERFDLLFLHFKDTDKAGEDGDVEAKARAIEEVDRLLPELLAMGPDVLAITGDHSTPAPLRYHGWHPVPVLLASDRCFADDCRSFTEAEAIRGHLGTFPASHLMGLLLANAGRLAKYGA